MLENSTEIWTAGILYQLAAAVKLNGVVQSVLLKLINFALKTILDHKTNYISSNFLLSNKKYNYFL